MEKVILVLFINGKLKISSKNLLCELANNVQYFEVGKKTLVKFIVKGLRGDPKNVNFEVNPNGIFELTTSKWKEIKAKTLMGENWRLQTYITAKKEGEANILVMIDHLQGNILKIEHNILYINKMDDNFLSITLLEIFLAIFQSICINIIK